MKLTFPTSYLIIVEGRTVTYSSLYLPQLNLLECCFIGNQTNSPYFQILIKIEMKQAWQLLSIRLMCLSFWFCDLIRDFPFWIFPWVQYFCDFTFFCEHCMAIHTMTKLLSCLNFIYLNKTLNQMIPLSLTCEGVNYKWIQSQRLQVWPKKGGKLIIWEIFLVQVP